MSINRVLVSGHLTRNPELRRTQSGTNVLSFGVAVNDRRRNQSTGEWEDYANFFDCVMFGNRAESLSKLLNKGMKVAIEGKLRWSQWEQDGDRKSKVSIIVSEVEFMSDRRNRKGEADNGSPSPEAVDGGAAAQSAQQAGNAAVDANLRFEEVPSVYDDDIPF